MLQRFRKKPEIVEAQQSGEEKVIQAVNEYKQVTKEDWIVYEREGFIKVYTNEQFLHEFEPVTEQLATMLDDMAKIETQKNSAYSERNELVAFLSRLYPSHLTRHPDSDETWENDWRYIVCVHTPTGEMSWHIHDSEVKKFGDLKVEENDWDGHTTEDKYARLRGLPHETTRK